MPKYTLSEPTKDCATRFIERDAVTLSCPYHTSYNEEGVPSNANCGDWCALCDIQKVEEKEIAYLLCGSGNAAYTIEK